MGASGLEAFGSIVGLDTGLNAAALESTPVIRSRKSAASVFTMSECVHERKCGASGMMWISLRA